MPEDKSYQLDLFGELLEDAWRKEWVDMPEFVQEDLRPFQSLLIHFENEQSRIEFAKLLDQTITELTKSIWFPKSDAEPPKNRRYIDES